MARMTKEVLSQENISLGLELAKFKNFELALRENDRNRRVEFAKAFNWQVTTGMFNYQDEYQTPSWEQIFVKIGKLLVHEGVNESSKEISQLKEIVCKLGEELQSHLNKE